jgi:hypothetical protein
VCVELLLRIVIILFASILNLQDVDMEEEDENETDLVDRVIPPMELMGYHGWN